MPLELNVLQCKTRLRVLPFLRTCLSLAQEEKQTEKGMQITFAFALSQHKGLPCSALLTLGFSGASLPGWGWKCGWQLGGLLRRARASFSFKKGEVNKRMNRIFQINRFLTRMQETAGGILNLLYYPNLNYYKPPFYRKPSSKKDQNIWGSWTHIPSLVP